jgi:23S rRNA maturation-related 3'-5' exoribonuclease YhaM
MDFLIISAVLHDVSKLLEYEQRDGKEVLSRTGELYPHGFHGARMAFEAGLPEEIVHIIATHAPTSSEIPKVAEGLILHYCDLIDADLNRFRVGTHMWVQSTKGRK